MNIEDLLKNRTLEFIELWNHNKLHEVKGYLKEDIIVYSPNISIIYPENNDGFIKGIDQVIEYWALLIKHAGTFTFTLESFNKNDHDIYTISKIEGRHERLYTWFNYNEYGKITKLKFEYK